MTVSRQIRVLIADDDPLQRSLISARLASLSGAAVEAENGAVAWDLLAEQTFDMVIADLSMPGLDGFGLIQCMRSHPRTKHLPIIVITSRDDKEAIAKAFAAGASSFLVKPIVWATFEHHIGYLLRLSQSAHEARIAGHKMLATNRAKETLLHSLNESLSAATEAILAEIHVLRSPRLQSDSSCPPVERLRRIETACARLDEQSKTASSVLEMLRTGVHVDDHVVQLFEIAERAIATVLPEADAKTLELIVEPPPRAISLSCDASAIELALMHLLRNAIERSPSGGRVSLTADITADGMLVIEIADEGPGMSPERVAQSLALGQVGAGRPEDSHGAGTGLLTKAIAEAHGGALEIRSMPSQGTSALLCLPADRVLCLESAA